MYEFDRMVIVTKKTALQELVERFGTREQARFYLEHAGASFGEYEAAHESYRKALRTVEEAVPAGARAQYIERDFLPTYTFGPRDLVVTLGPDGLVVNTAKYLEAQALLALNPDPRRIDGILVPFPCAMARHAFERALRAGWRVRHLSMAQARLGDGQTLHAVNDFYIGQATQTSALYRLKFGRQEEDQSSSGIIVSTGTGSTGWLKSVVTGALRTVQAMLPAGQAELQLANPRFDGEAEQLVFHVREPFISKTSGADVTFGRIDSKSPLSVTSRMPQHGVIFSDGIEDDYLQFNSGAIAAITVAERKLHLMVP